MRRCADNQSVLYFMKIFHRYDTFCAFIDAIYALCARSHFVSARHGNTYRIGAMFVNGDCRVPGMDCFFVDRVYVDRLSCAQEKESELVSIRSRACCALKRDASV